MILRLLADENVPGPAVEALRRRGHDVRWVRDEAEGAADPDVLAWAVRESRVLLTFDKDFGALARVGPFPRESGVVLVRLPHSSLAELVARLVPALEGEAPWSGRMTVIEPGRIRSQPLRRPANDEGLAGD